MCCFARNVLLIYVVYVVVLNIPFISSYTTIGIQTCAAMHMAVSSSFALVLCAGETVFRTLRVALGQPVVRPPLSTCRESALALVVVPQ